MRHSSYTQPFLFFLSLLFMFSACGSKTNPEWLEVIPQSAVVLHIQDQNTDDALLTRIGEMVLEPLLMSQYLGIAPGTSLRGSALIPESVDKMSPLWVLEADLEKTMSQLQPLGWLSTRQYKTEGGTIHQYRRGDSTLTASQLGKWLVLSTRTNAIEQCLMTRSGKLPRFDDTATKGLHVNVSGLGRLLAPIAAPGYRSALTEVFAGLGVVHLSAEITEQSDEMVFKIPLKDKRSALVSYLIARQPDPGMAYRVPMGMSMMLHLHDPIGQMPYDSLRGATGDNPRLASAIEQLRGAMDSQLSFYVQEGAAGNVAWVRKADMKTVKSIFETLWETGFIDGENGVFVSRSRELARTIGSGLNTIDNLVIGLAADGIIVSSNQTLVNRLMDVPASSMRDLGSRMPQFIEAGTGAPASAFWVDLNSILTTARSAGWLAPGRSLPPLLQSISEMGSRIHSGDGAIYMHLKVNRSTSSRSNDEMVLAWQYPLRGESIIAVPRLAQVSGKTTVILTTDRGRVMGFNADGSLVFNVNAGSKTPIDGAVSYDWFGNKSPVIFQAAGNTIYAWSPTGSLLPGFPFTFEATITAPIIITDSNRDGEPEIIAATDDQRLHMINRDGRSLAGWPVSTSGIIRSKPIVSFQNEQWQIRVETENAFEIFNRGGDEMESSPRISDLGSEPDSLNGLPLNSPYLNYSQARFAAFPLSADLDGDGIQELIIVSEGQIRCYRIQRLGSN
jgi:hypothetical protein